MADTKLTDLTAASSVAAGDFFYMVNASGAAEFKATRDQIVGTNKVATGGTGLATITAHCLLIGNGTTALTIMAALTDGQIIVGQTGADPLPKTVGGDLTLVATGAFTIVSGAVTYAKMQNISAADKLLGSSHTAGAQAVQEITLGTNLSMSGTTLNATGGGGSPGGSDLSIQYNNDSAFGGFGSWDDVAGLLTITGLAHDGAALAKFAPDSGASSVVIGNNGTVVIDSDVSTGGSPLTIKYAGSILWTFSFNGALNGATGAFVDPTGGGFAKFRGNGTDGELTAYNNLRLTAGGGGLGGTGKVQVSVGTGSVLGGIGGTIFDHFADVATTHTDGTEDDLYTDTVGANVLGTNGDKIEAFYNGIIVSSATASRRVQAYFGGTKILDSGTQTFTSAGTFDIWITVIRESSTVVRVAAEFVAGGITLQPTVTYTRITGLTLSSTNIIKITGIAAATGAAASDIVAKSGNIKWQPAA